MLFVYLSRAFFTFSFLLTYVVSTGVAIYGLTRVYSLEKSDYASVYYLLCVLTVLIGVVLCMFCLANLFTSDIYCIFILSSLLYAHVLAYLVGGVALLLYQSDMASMVSAYFTDEYTSIPGIAIEIFFNCRRYGQKGSHEDNDFDDCKSVFKTKFINNATIIGGLFIGFAIVAAILAAFGFLFWKRTWTGNLTLTRGALSYPRNYDSNADSSNKSYASMTGFDPSMYSSSRSRDRKKGNDRKKDRKDDSDSKSDSSRRSDTDSKSDSSRRSNPDTKSDSSRRSDTTRKPDSTRKENTAKSDETVIIINTEDDDTDPEQAYRYPRHAPSGRYPVFYKW